MTRVKTWKQSENFQEQSADKVAECEQTSGMKTL